jgi:N-methylhydantoinase A/oxoprolinase/acetone carboxylase beta subunit
VGGVRTLFRMPDLLSLGLGGGTLVEPAPLTIGPRSVGYRLTDEALVFGGTTLTCTDLAVAAGLIELGDPVRVAHLSRDLVAAGIRLIHERIAEAVDRMKTDAGDVPVIAVGGGSFLVPPRMPGVSEVVRVAHHPVANAVGAAIAQISGELDQVFQNMTREAALAEARRLAEERAVRSGASRESLKVVEVEDIPLAYLPGNSLRTRVRVVGDIAAPR